MKAATIVKEGHRNGKVAANGEVATHRKIAAHRKVAKHRKIVAYDGLSNEGCSRENEGGIR